MITGKLLLRRISSVIITLFIFQHCLAEKTDDSDFYAYYTKVNYGEPGKTFNVKICRPNY